MRKAVTKTCFSWLLSSVSLCFWHLSFQVSHRLCFLILVVRAGKDTAANLTSRTGANNIGQRVNAHLMLEQMDCARKGGSSTCCYPPCARPHFASTLKSQMCQRSLIRSQSQLLERLCDPADLVMQASDPRIGSIVKRSGSHLPRPVQGLRIPSEGDAR